MDLERFRESPIGHLAPIRGHDARFNEEYEHAAFVPDPLPDRVELASDTWASVADAGLAIGRLDDATSRFPNPTLLVRPTLRREAVSTSALEGTITDLDDVLAADEGDAAELPPDLREVINAVLATEFGVEQVDSGRPLSVHLACQLQEILIRGTPTEGPETGRPRTKLVLIGREDQRVAETRFVPCPHGPQLEVGFRQWESWIRSDNGIHLLVKVALGHYQFETLHPFHDGNGRVGRTLAILQLIAGGALHHPNLALSAWLEEHDDEYRDGLSALSQTGNFDAWVAFFCRALEEQSKREQQRIDHLLGLRDRLVSQVREHTYGLAVQIAEDLIGYPYIKVPAISSRYVVSFEAANKAVARLVDIQVLKRVDERRYDRAFFAPDVMAALRAPG